MRRNLVSLLVVLLVASLPLASAGPLNGLQPGPTAGRASLGGCDVHVYPEGPGVAVNCDARGSSGQQPQDESSPSGGACFSLRLGVSPVLTTGCGDAQQAQEAALLP